MKKVNLFPDFVWKENGVIYAQFSRAGHGEAKKWVEKGFAEREVLVHSETNERRQIPKEVKEGGFGKSHLSGAGGKIERDFEGHKTELIRL